LSSCLTPKNLKIKIHITIVLHIVVYGCETWFLTLREEHGFKMFENRVLRRILGPNRKWWLAGKDCTMGNFTTCMLHQILLW
jgi:hypothetical protein